MLDFEFVVRVMAGLKKSPGTVRGVPYTSSAKQHPKSSLGAVQIPNSTEDKSCVQLGPVRCSHRADLR